MRPPTNLRQFSVKKEKPRETKNVSTNENCGMKSLARKCSIRYQKYLEEVKLISFEQVAFQTKETIVKQITLS